MIEKIIVLYKNFEMPEMVGKSQQETEEYLLSKGYIKIDQDFTNIVMFKPDNGKKVVNSKKSATIYFTNDNKMVTVGNLCTSTNEWRHSFKNLLFE